MLSRLSRTLTTSTTKLATSTSMVGGFLTSRNTSTETPRRTTQLKNMLQGKGKSNLVPLKIFGFLC